MDRLDSLDPEFRKLATPFLAAVAAAGIEVTVTSGRRTIAQQNALYAQGRTAKGPVVTNAKGGSSPHNFGCAIDIVPLKDGKADWNAPAETWRKLGAIGKECGLVWGGDFKSIRDWPHFESPTWRDLRAAWQRGEIQVA